MKRLEIIQLRMAGNVPSGLINDIRRSIFTGGEMGTVRLYFHATIPTDLSVHIYLESNANSMRKCNLGVRLAAALGEYGMVQHTMWIEDESEE